jgi:hypothetical protein
LSGEKLTGFPFNGPESASDLMRIQGFYYESTELSAISDCRQEGGMVQNSAIVIRIQAHWGGLSEKNV